ncbi:BolA family transcriptional regulator [Rhodoplanes sp. TEM]|uniref:BolA family transcriptional regulator n=1 Tax=Rhodoplanes tepidamans TaxID=200616 RepID=A0ABT5J5I8_RHOTP|nr:MULTISPECIES: BolA family protein [Rhodoplanes]MDC7784564.1 BolA family transcriptional regulator [Rhodoplanes tepidamans]MDC7984471.1 BolA family transcriptional regulator [Rhodoplanes sp. TEM]MDQ0355792.1 BolA protein [Rhodoplanes tepidamans]
MLVRDVMTEKLSAAFAPASLEVIDESHRHEGHAGARPGGQTHFRVRIVSEAFRGKSRLDRHRAVNQALAAEIAGGVHALAIEASAPGEG